MKIINFYNSSHCYTKTCMILLLTCASSLHLYAQEPSINFSGKEMTILSAFGQIEKQTNLTIAYNESIIDVNQKVVIETNNRPLSETMAFLLKGTSTTFTIKGNQLLIVPAKQAYKNKKISGMITSESGESIVGASVIIKGTTEGTITNIDGAFTINAPQQSILSISYIGYLTKEIRVGEKTELQIQLEEDAGLLDEVVVVGYGVQKKRDVTTAIATLRASDMKGVPAASMTEAMVGKMPGVLVTQPSGTPGGALQIKVRGTGTITAGISPLYVVDGVPLAQEQLNTFNMNDVESIEVLKDASSAAIYGSRGSNGVILISTKKGNEGRATVAYNGYYGWQSVSKKIDMLNAYEYADLVNDARNNTYTDAMKSINRRLIAQGGQPLTFNTNDNNALRLGNTGTNYNAIVPVEILPYLNGEKGLTDTDWQDEIFRIAAIQNHTASVSGGSKKVKYYTSFDYFNQEGVILNSDFTRYSTRMNLDVNEGIFKFGLAFNPSFTIENAVNSDGSFSSDGGGIVASALHSAPIFSVYNADGTFNFSQNSWSANAETVMPDGSIKIGNSQTQAWNPVALAVLQQDKRKAARIFGNTYARVDFLQDFNYHINLGFDIYNSSRDRFRPSTLPLANTRNNPESVAEAHSYTDKVYNWLLEQTVNYNKKIGKHSLNAIAGWTMQYQRDESTYMFANGFMTNTIPTLNAGTVTRGNTRASEWMLLSGLARVQYNYEGKYMLSGAVRTDGASRFGKSNRWGWFPSISAGWRMSQESFMQSLTFLDDLKFRASYGLTGNFRIPNYGALGEISYYSYVLGGSSSDVIKGAAPSKMPNPALRWEKTAQINVGFDASLFRNRLTFGMDIYNSNTYDLLLNVPVPMTTGYQTRLENIGKVNNKGIEFNAVTNHQFGDFSWTGHFNISKNINKVKELGPGNADIITNGSVSNAYFVTRVGEAIGSYFLPVVEGVFMNQAEVDATLHYRDSPANYGLNDSKPGDFRFKDVNNDGILDISDTDRAIVGNYMPKFTYGFGTSFMWKGVDLSIECQGVQGNKILNLSRRYFYNIEGNMNNYKGALNRWKSESDPGDGFTPRANRVSKGQNGTTSTWHIEDGSYLRIRNVTLGYQLPKSMINKAYIKNARLYVSVQNPFTFTKYKGYNPEVSNSKSPTTNGEDYGMYPLAKIISIGANLTF